MDASIDRSNTSGVYMYFMQIVASLFSQFETLIGMIILLVGIQPHYTKSGRTKKLSWKSRIFAIILGGFLVIYTTNILNHPYVNGKLTVCLGSKYSSGCEPVELKSYLIAFGIWLIIIVGLQIRKRYFPRKKPSQDVLTE